MKDLVFLRDQRGATAVEFAIIAPVFILIILGTIMAGLSLWYGNLLQDVVTEAARCIAVRSDPCTVKPDGCATNAGTCYVIDLASKRGLDGLTASNMTIDPAAVVGAGSFTKVTLSYPFEILNLPITLHAEAVFPNE